MLVGKRIWSLGKPLKLVLDAQSEHASSLNIIKQVHIFQSYCSQIQEGQNQILQSLHFCDKSQGKAIREKFELLFSCIFVFYEAHNISKEEEKTI